jgi:hypothetical protein
MHRWLLGTEYRALWTTPIRVPIIDLSSFGGGLTPTTAGGGRQTLSLRFDAADGLKYGFRSIDKDPDVLDATFQGTVIEDVIQDQISSAHPAGPAVASRLMEAAEILHTEPRLVVLPDDPLLGEHRERFANAIGFIEARAVAEPGVPSFADADEIIGDDDIFLKLRKSNRHRVDTRSFLTARLFDMFIGDWDRHRGQWTWARFGNDRVTEWVAIPEDRDQAFVRYDGIAMSIARWTAPQLVNFTEKRPNVIGVNWNAREVDRHFLPDLERRVWDSIATHLQTVMTDAVIEDAVRAMPVEYYELKGPEIAATLRARRDWLVDLAHRYYDVLAREADVHASDDAESVTITRNADGTMSLTIARADGSEFFSRRFLPDETDEVRLYLYGGADRIVIEGAGAATIVVRIIAGDGADTVINRSGAGKVHMYDALGAASVSGDRVDLDRKPYIPPQRPPGNSPPHRDWGTLWTYAGRVGYSPDLGLTVQGDATRTSYGFRAVPFATQSHMRAGWAFKHDRGDIDIRTTWQQPNARYRYELTTILSGVRITRFHGLGNEVQATGSSRFYRVNQVQFLVLPELVVPVGTRFQVALGAGLKYTNTRDRPGTLLTDSLSGIYGDNKFGQIGGSARFVFDSRDAPWHPTKGLRVELGGSFRPKLWDVDSTAFGEIHGVASTYLSATHAPLSPTLAFRIGGKRVFGTFPFMEAAFIGDAETVRLGRENRFAGDAAIWGNLELRVRFSELFILVPQHVGALVLFDVGRVFLDGEVSDTWHTAYGGGIWIAPLSQTNTVSVAWAQSRERGGLYLQVGFAF